MVHPATKCHFSRFYKHSSSAASQSPVMAYIANYINASTPKKAELGHVIPDSPESAILSPEIKEAMDRIFPRSATQFFQEELSFGEYSRFRPASVGETKETSFGGFRAMSSSTVDSATFSCIRTANDITTVVSTDAAAVAPTGTDRVASTRIATSASQNDLADLNSSSVLTSDAQPQPITLAPVSNNNNRDESSLELESKSLELTRKVQSKNRISKADFEIVTSCEALISEYERTSRKANSVDMSSSECRSGGDSDSEDMSRPFASIAREKKKRKRRKAKVENYAEKVGNNYLSEHNVNSSDEFLTSSKSWKTNDNSASMNGAGDCRMVAQTDFVSETRVAKQNESSATAFIKKNALAFNQNMQDDSSNNYILGSGRVKDAFYKDCGVTSEDISNISYSSAKENLQGEKIHSHQRLPKHQYFHIVKHRKKIRNTFPPCFVVAEKTNTLQFYKYTKDLNMDDGVLPLSVRLKTLSALCDKGSLACTKNKKMAAANNLEFMNIFCEMYGNSDDEFEKPRGRRNLRKRNKKVCYVEPSEDDILDEFSNKYSPVKRKNGSAGKSEDESTAESRKKKQDLFQTSAVAVVPSSDNNDKATVSDKKKANIERDKNVFETDSHKKKEIFVNPASMSNEPPYHARTEGLLTSEVYDNLSHMYSQETSNHISTVPSYISVLSSNNMPGAFPSYMPGVFPCNIPGAFPSHPATVSHFPSVPLSFLGGLARQPFIEEAPTSYPVSAASEAQLPRHLCLMKMNGKDVYLRLVPSGGMGVPLPMIVPNGSALMAPSGPTHMFSQPPQPAHSVSNSTHSLLRQMTSLATVSQGNVVSAAPLQSLYGVPNVNRAVHTTSQNISLPALPVMSSSHLAGHMSAAGNRPISLTSLGAYVSHNSAAVTASTTFEQTASDRSVYTNSQNISLPALPVMSSSHLAGHMSAAGNRPISLTSLGAYISHNSAAVTASTTFEQTASDRSVYTNSQNISLPALPMMSSHLTGHMSAAGNRPISLTSLGTYESRNSAPVTASTADEQTASVRSVYTNSQNISLPALPVMSSVHLAGYMSAAGIKPISLTSSGTYVSHGSAPVTTLATAKPMASVRPAHTNSQNISLPALPVMSSAYLAGYMSAAGIRPMSSGTYVSHGLAPVTALATSETTASVRPVYTNSQNISLPALPVMSSANIAGHMRVAGSRPITSGTFISHNSASVTSVASATSETTSYVRPVHTKSQNVSLPALPALSAHLTGHMIASGIKPLSLTSSGTYVSQNSAPVTTSAFSEATSVKPVHTSSQNVSLPALPAHLAGHMSTACTTPVPLTSKGRYISHSSAPVTSVSETAAPVRPHSSSNMSAQILHAPLVQQAAPNQSTSDRPVRTIVHGCSATGTPGHFTVLASTNSELLPQCKRHSDHELSPEQHAAKRRKLEKKYPLPPGVVIKTEPLDVPTTLYSTTTSRSLLPETSRSLNSSSPSCGVQNQQIISSSLARDASVGNIRGDSDLTYRTALTVEQTALVPSSWGLMRTATVVTSPSLTVSPAAAASVATVSTTTDVITTAVNTHCITVTSLNTAASQPFYWRASCVPSSRLFTPLSQSNVAGSSSTSASSYNSGTAGDSLAACVAPTVSAVVTSCETAVTINEVPRFSSSSSVNIVSKYQSQLHLSKAAPRTASLDSVRNNLEELRKIIQVQESCGLKGERLEKLKELLRRNEQLYVELIKMAKPCEPLEAASESTGSRNLIDGGPEELPVVNASQKGGSEANPFVID